MNNYLLQSFREAQGVPVGERIEEQLIEARNILETIKGLRENKSFSDFKRLVLEPFEKMVQRRIELNIKNLIDDINGSITKEILRDQGILLAYKKFNLDILEAEKKVAIEGLQKLIKLNDYKEKSGETK